jgi:hypothetical protein
LCPRRPALRNDADVDDDDDLTAPTLSSPATIESFALKTLGI